MAYSCPNDWCRMFLDVDGAQDAFSRARNDPVFFWHYFLNRCPHPGQANYVRNANATVNALACSNRYGKTTLLAGRHFHSNVFKIGAEPRYVDDAGSIDLDKFIRLPYQTVHAAGLWEQASDPWEDALRLIDENGRLAAFVKDAPRSKPPHIDFIHGARWRFRTLGDDGSGVDGKSFYLISIDEAGWLARLEEMMNNVLRIRVGDVRGRIDIVGTFKPGVSKDFFKICVRAAAKTGASLGFDHRGDSTGDEEAGSLDAAIRKYARELGFDLDEEIAKARAAGVIE